MNNKTWLRNLLFIAILIATACGPSEDGSTDYLVTIETPMGDMKAILYEETPLHKANFIQLAKEGKYDNTIWHRVIQGFMIQGGDVYGGNQEPEGGRIPAEIKPGIYHVRGALAAARQSDEINPERKSSSCQFYVVQGEPYEKLITDLGLLNAKFGEMLSKDPQKHKELIEGYQEAITNGGQRGAIDFIYGQKELCSTETGTDFEKLLGGEKDDIYKKAGGGTTFLDGNYTVFGMVVEGLDVIDKIAAVTTGPGDKPLDDITMEISVKSVSKSEITEKYGYQYPVVQ